jgi:hypothetical protein
LFDTYLYADGQVGMRLYIETIGESFAQRSNFVAGNYGGTISESHEADHAGQL